MSTLDDVRSVLADMNGRFPRPALPPLEASPVYDILSSFAESYPSYNLPGVYILLNEAGVVLRIGKASCGSDLAGRLTAYFKWDDRAAGKGIAKDPTYRDVRYVSTIGIPADRAFEAPAIEEFLLRHVTAPLNRNGVG